MSWMYVTTTGEPQPAEESELPGLARHGLLRPSTLVWHPGRADWAPVGELKPEIFGASASASAGLNLGRTVLEPLWQERGWLTVLAVALLAAGLLRSVLGVMEAWPDPGRLVLAVVPMAVLLVVAWALVGWWRALGRAATTLGLQEAREAARKGGRVLVVGGLVGLLLLLAAAYDVIALVTRAFLKG